MSFSFTKRNQESELYLIELILDGGLPKTYNSKTVDGVKRTIDCLTSKYPEHNKVFYVQRVIDYKPIKVKGEVL